MVCHRHLYLYCTQWSCMSSSLRLTTALCVCVCVCVCECVCVCVMGRCFIYVYMLLFVCVCVCVCVYIYIYIFRYFSSQLSTFTSVRDKKFQNVKCTSPSPCSGPTYSCSSLFTLVGLRKCALSVFHIGNESADRTWIHQERAKFPEFFGDTLTEKLPYNVVCLYKMLPSQVLLDFSTVRIQNLEALC